MLEPYVVDMLAETPEVTEALNSARIDALTAASTVALTVWDAEVVLDAVHVNDIELPVRLIAESR
ncbi:hypothetical protein CUD01_12070 [Cellulomonas uda]|uniref:Uncharacterized protein n=1 Tax=Cellulomonas uda TaxID=1714 RepID=A0A4Y3K9V3_CELUD|nr:hypothetical protein CUD01_12070 [Cellulomonas uda]